MKSYDDKIRVQLEKEGIDDNEEELEKERKVHVEETRIGKEQVRKGDIEEIEDGREKLMLESEIMEEEGKETWLEFFLGVKVMRVEGSKGCVI